jgi:acyl CoA:acetate/3-ketoacid CoA transferase
VSSEPRANSRAVAERRSSRPRSGDRWRGPAGPRFLTAEEAVALVGDGAHLSIEGSGGGLLEPAALLAALGRRFRETESPRDLTVSHTTGIGDREGSGMDYLAQPGLIRRVVAGNWGMAPRMSELALEGAFEAYNFPQGVMAQLYREVTAGRPGLVTHVGIGTFCDPRLEGGRLNERTTEELVEVVEVAGSEWLFYPAFPIDVCFIRATTADDQGNLTFEQEAARLESLAIAQATHNLGGLVIAQVKLRATGGTLDPRDVVVPGILVDAVVVTPDQRQVDTHEYNPGFAGATRVALSSLPPFPLDQRKVVARRAIREIHDGDVVNLGVGIADGVAAVAAVEGYLDLITLTIEQGIVGGVPARGVIFGVATNPDAILDQPSQFDFYDGGGLDTTFLGFAQIDRDGNVNVSKFGDRLIGTGGFVNISQNARIVVFCGTFTAGGLEAVPDDGQLNLVREGRNRKFVEQVEQITFNGAEASSRGQRVIYVTERAVFELGEHGLRLCEVAPGIDVTEHVLALLPFEVDASNYRLMDPRIFRPDPLGPNWRTDPVPDDQLAAVDLSLPRPSERGAA